jgi:hypothetical protein
MNDRTKRAGPLPEKPVLVAALVGVLSFLPVMQAGAQTLSVNPGRFGAMTCQQHWYVEQEVLAEGRVCLKSERARRAFRRAERCISSSENILPVRARDYLETLRQSARAKQCPGFQAVP